MKREIPATPFRVVGPDQGWSTSSGSPEQMLSTTLAVKDNMPQDQQSSAQLVPQSSQLVASSSSQLTGAARTSGSRASGQSSRVVPGPDGATFNQFNQQTLL